MPHPQLKHKQIEQELRSQLQALPAGSKVASERELAVSYGCNFLTVRKAMKRLVADGVIVRHIGSGTFVAETAQSERCRCAVCGQLIP